MNYTVTKNNKLVAMTMMVIGVATIAYGFMTHSDRMWANLLVDNFFFMAISLAGTFFVAVQYVAQVGWSAMIKRIPEATSQWLPVAAVIMIIIFYGGGHHLYHWTNANLFDKTSPEYDPIMDGKKAFLNIPFFSVRMFLYFGVWIALTRMLRKESIEEDLDGSISHYNRCIRWGTMFVVFFAASSSTSAWDFLMSVDSHWFSTMFGWYTFAGLFVSGLSVMMLVLLYLKSNNYIPEVNDNHMHDLGKFMFAFSVFWTYLWFCQFMLIWYANLPEEVIYFKTRWENGFKGLFIGNFFINFIMPFLILMSRDAKRNRNFLVVAGLIIVCGHWLDVFLMVMPGTVGTEWGFGIIEIGTFLGFAGGFIWVVLHSLSKAALIPKHHPLMHESAHHHI